MYCKNIPEACLGNDKCKEGHTGILCENCDIINNYSHRGKDCLKCDKRTNIYIQMLVFFLISCFILGNQIYGLS